MRGVEKYQVTIFLFYFYNLADDNMLNNCINKLLSEQRKICLQASDNSLSSFSLKMILRIYERYFAALSRSKLRKTTAVNRESIFIYDKTAIFESETKENMLTPSEKAKMELAKIGSRTAMNFFFASLKRAWKSGDTELCSELLSDSLEAIQLSLEPGALFDTSSLSTLWLEAIEKSVKFLRQIVLNDLSDTGSGSQIPKADRNMSLNLLLELQLQKGTLAGSLESVVLLMTLSEMSLNLNDNRNGSQSSNGIPLIKIVNRYREIDKNVTAIPSTDQHPFSPTESFLRFLSLPDGDDEEDLLIDAQQAAVIIISHLDRVCRSHLPSKMWTSRIQNYRNQQIISLGYNGLSPEFNVFSSDSDEDKWMSDYSRMSNYSASTIDFGTSIIVEKIACAAKVIHLLSTSGEVYEVKLQGDHTKDVVKVSFETNSVICKIFSHCEGKHFMAISASGEGKFFSIFVWKML